MIIARNQLNRNGVALVALIAGLILPRMDAEAQYLNDVVRISQPEQGTTSRFKAMGNAQTSLGGDLSSLSGNPAGLGFFNQSDVSLSFDFLADLNDATYFDQKTSNTLNRFGISQAGIVFNIPSYRTRGSNLNEGWLNFNMGLGYFKTNDFNTTLGYSGHNPSSTFAHFLADQKDISDAGQLNPPLIEGEFGWESYLIDFNESNPENTYHYPVVLEGDNAQMNILTDRGWQSSVNLSFGANYSNKLYLGFSLGMPSFRYSGKQTLTESGFFKSYSDIYQENPNSEFLDNTQEAYDLLESDYELEYTYDQQTSGRGVNGTFGLIYKPIPSVNIGITATTPSWYWVTDEASTYMDTWYYEPEGTTPFFTYNSDEVTDYLEYTVRTPYRINGGISTIFAGYGLLSVDLEYVDYSSIRFSASDQLGAAAKARLDEDMNRAAKNNFTSAVNFRAGAEYLFADNLLGRIGYSHKGSPYKESSLKTETVSGGLGYRLNNMYIDLVYQNFSQSFKHMPYEIDTNWWTEAQNPEASVQHNRHQMMITLGFKF